MIYIAFSELPFKCPHCEREFNNHDYYVRKVYNSFQFKADIKCGCKKNFKLGLNRTGQFQTFK